MTRRLFYLNAVLMLGIITLGLRLKSLYEEARERETIVRLSQERKLVYKPGAPTPQVQAVNTASYSDVAIRMLFSRDRNPTVIIEEKPKLPDPPPPPLPKAHGVMMLDPPRIILTAKMSEGQKIYKAGDKVGDYEIIAFDTKTIQLRWHDKDYTKELSELADANPGGGAAPTTVEAPQPQGSSTSGPTVSGVPTAASAASIMDNPNAASKPVEAGDTSPAGTMKDNFRKVCSISPFGSACRWVPVR